MLKRFDPVAGRNADIIESVIATPEVSSLPEELQFKIRQSVEEIEENILGYSGTTWIEVEVKEEDGILSISFKDGGVKFDPLAKPDPDISAALEDRPIGGLGIFICKQIMDTLNYRFENNSNLFIMSKRIDRN